MMSECQYKFGSAYKPINEIIKHDNELWDIFTRKEEYSCQHSEYYKSYYLTRDHNYIVEPSVSKYLVRNGLEVEYPDNKPFAICLTHDVDFIYPPITHTLASSAYLVKALNMDRLKYNILWRMKGKRSSPYINFKEIMGLEEKYGAKSSFYFMTSDRDVTRPVYDIKDLEDELGYIIDKGFEVGLHGGYYTYDNIEEMKKEKSILENVLGKKIIGYRNHYLLFKVPDTWELLAEAGFRYDTTLGYNNAVGCRNGMCHPFKPYNLITDKEIDILEIPLNIMDSSLFNNIRPIDKAWEASKNVIDTVEQYHGVVTLLWHNNIFGSAYMRDWARLYNRILSYCHSKNAWMTNAESIYRWKNESIA